MKTKMCHHLSDTDLILQRSTSRRQMKTNRNARVISNFHCHLPRLPHVGRTVWQSARTFAIGFKIRFIVPFPCVWCFLGFFWRVVFENCAIRVVSSKRSVKRVCVLFAQMSKRFDWVFFFVLESILYRVSLVDLFRSGFWIGH